MNIRHAPSHPPTKGRSVSSLYKNAGDSVSGLLKAINWTGLKYSSNNRWVRLAVCGLLAGAGYLLFLIADGFPPRAWGLLFDVLPRLQSLWADQGFGVLLPLIGLLLFSFSLLILWSLIVLGISYSLVHLWPASQQENEWQTYLNKRALQTEQQAPRPSQPKIRLQPAHGMHSASTQADIYAEPTQRMQQPSEQQSRSMLQPQQFQQSLPQQIQPLRGAVPAYEPIIGAGRGLSSPLRSYGHHTGGQHAHLRLVPEQREPAQHLPEGPEDEEVLSGAEDIEELEHIQSVPTRPGGVSEERTKPPYVAWNEDDEEQEATLRLVTGIGLDPGLVRKDRPNEDSLFAIQGVRATQAGPVPAGLFVVADGMGGHANGADASRLAVREISNVIVPTLLRDESDDSGDELEEDEFFINLLKDGVYRANLAIYQRNHTMPHMMGTTITTALVVDSTAYVINVGDSRTYLYRAADGLVQVTRDHSTVARLVEEGEIEQDEIYTHPQRNQIYRCLGEHPMVEMDTFVVPLEPDDILLLCSDGLWEMVRDPVMEKIVASSSHLPAQVSNILVQAALNQGGVDNISVVVVGVVKTTL